MRDWTVEEVMSAPAVSTGVGTSYKEIARQLAEHHISGLPVVDGYRRVVGVVSETGLLAKEAEPGWRPRAWAERLRRRVGRRERSVAVKARAARAGELMSAPAVTVSEHISVGDAARIMRELRVSRLPVVDWQGRLVGIVTRGDLLRVFVRSDADIRDEIVHQVLPSTLVVDPAQVHVRVADGVAILDGEVERRTEVDLTGVFNERVVVARTRPGQWFAAGVRATSPSTFAGLMGNDHVCRPERCSKAD